MARKRKTHPQSRVLTRLARGPVGVAVTLASLALGLSGCGEAQAGKGSLAAPKVAALPVLVRDEHAKTHTVQPAGHDVEPGPLDDFGGLSGAQHLRPFFAALARLQQPEPTSDVRVVHYGDSHTAADFQTGATRRALAAVFGDGGRGFVALGTPFKYYKQEGVRGGRTTGFETESHAWKNGQLLGDGHYGLHGVRLTASKRGLATTELRSPIAAGSELEVYFLRTQRGGTVDVHVDGARVGTIASRGERRESGFFRVPLPEGARVIELHSRGDGEVQLFGGALDAPEHGIVYDAIGKNGARAASMLDWDEGHFAEQLAHRDPRLVILSFGTNEAGDTTSARVYTERLQRLVERLKRAVPESACLLVGPPDRAVKEGMTRRAPRVEVWQTMPRVLELIELQRQVATTVGCGFYDQLQIMGGAGSVARWAEESPPRAQRDRVHLTRDGYVELGERFAHDLLEAYRASVPQAR